MVFVETLGSNQGTMLDGAPVRGRAAFQPGQEIRCGDYSLAVRRAAPPPQNRRFRPPPPAPCRRRRIDPEQEQRRQMKRQIHTVLLERLDMKG